MLPGILDREGRNEVLLGVRISGLRVWGLLDSEQAAPPHPHPRLWVSATPLHCPGQGRAGQGHVTASAPISLQVVHRLTPSFTEARLHPTLHFCLIWGIFSPPPHTSL